MKSFTGYSNEEVAEMFRSRYSRTNSRAVNRRLEMEKLKKSELLKLSVWQRSKNWANTPTSGRGPFQFATGGKVCACGPDVEDQPKISKQPVADAFRAMKKPDPPPYHVVRAHVCTRPLPHICKENGPCNGWPKQSISGEQRLLLLQAGALARLAEREKLSRNIRALMSSPRLNFYFWDNQLYQVPSWLPFHDCSVIYSCSSEDRQHCYRFDNAIPCWLFRGNAELCIKQCEDIKASGKCIVELTYNGGATWYRCSNLDVSSVFNSYEEARQGIVKNLERYPNDNMMRRIRRLL